MRGKQLLLYYLVTDILTSAAAWFLFILYRKKIVEPKKYGIPIEFEFDNKLILSLLVIPLFWLILYSAFGAYKKLQRRHRLKELGQTLLLTFIGVNILFFAFILDDEIPSYKTYYQSYLTLFFLHFTLNFSVRILLTSNTVKKVHSKIIGFPTIIVGGSDKAIETVQEFESIKNYPGNQFVGFVSLNGADTSLKEHGIKHLGELSQISKLIKEHKVEEVLIAIDSSEHKNIGDIINTVDDNPVAINIIPDMYDILAGSVKMTSIFGAPLIKVNTDLMAPWEFSLKRIFDVAVSIFALLILSPVFLALAILVKMSSKGPVFFKQERIGIHRTPFNIFKFRTMYTDAEKAGPQLSSSNDKRITPIGKFLRKTRLDEIPQFINVIKGDMSIVGPRPERQFYIEKITEKAPHYVHLHKVKPGITSWGQVKFGYAENVDQMVQRLKFDLLYIENMSFALDIKILFYTVLIILKGAGK